MEGVKSVKVVRYLKDADEKFMRSYVGCLDNTRNSTQRHEKGLWYTILTLWP